MPPARTLLLISVGTCIVVVSFAATTYFMNLVLPRSNVSFDQTAVLPTATLRPVQRAVSENLVWPSEDFTIPKWTRNQIATVEPTAATAPNGENAASLLIESADNGRHFIGTNVAGVTPGSIHTFSVYFRPTERSIRLEFADSPKGKYGNAICDFSKADTIGSVAKGGDTVDGAVERVGNGWYRCWAAMPFDDRNASVVIELDQNGTFPYRGDGHSGELIWGAQFEVGGRPTAYVATITSPLAKVH
jgi:hypothetical protein